MSELALIQLDSIDSTNNYAMQMIDADKAQHGTTIIAKSQTAGRGQRGKTWTDAPGQSLLMTVITVPAQSIQEQFAFNASVAVAIVKVLQYLYNNSNFFIKWPNDIIVNDKKTGGILIENVLRGSRWAYSVIGLGLNVNQLQFPSELPFATSLKIETGANFDLQYLATTIRDSILSETAALRTAERRMNLYNSFLYKRGQQQGFSRGGDHWFATINEVHMDGTIEVTLADGSKAFYQHGHVLWDWGRSL